MFALHNGFMSAMFHRTTGDDGRNQLNSWQTAKRLLLSSPDLKNDKELTIQQETHIGPWT